MLTLDIANATDKIVVTLNEKMTPGNTRFIFSFDCVTSRELVEVSKQSFEDLSPAPARYNEFEIATSALFNGKSAGQWQYKVYETIDGTTKGKQLENGKMLLKSAPINITGYEAQTTYS